MQFGNILELRKDLLKEGVSDLDFTEMVFRLWFCCIITSACVSAATVLTIVLIADKTKEKKKARLVEEDEPKDVHNIAHH